MLRVAAAAPRSTTEDMMGEPDTAESLADLTARHIVGQTVDDDERGTSFRISDGEDAVDIRHDIGDPMDAAQALDQLAAAIRGHASLIRRREHLLRHGPLTGPVPWPGR